jgi:hypothetical protein
MSKPASPKTPAQTFALVFGIVYLCVGVAGFFITGMASFAAYTDKHLVIFGINPLHNVVHIVLGIVWVGAARVHAHAKLIDIAFGIVLGVAALLGFAGLLRLLAITSGDADNFLHLATSALSLYFGTAGGALESVAGSGGSTGG